LCHDTNVYSIDAQLKKLAVCSFKERSTVLIHKENQNTMQTALCFTFYLSGQLLPEGWVYFQSSLYHVSSTKKTWQESRDDCLSRGADLMIIDSQEEQVAYDFLRRLSKEMWIGLTDSAQEGTWRWVDGTLLRDTKVQLISSVLFHTRLQTWSGSAYSHFARIK
uniref:C-type lectin domain-containing protein n=1 Tax=Salarias fasciatus TaxID=181472 RepID=A0A672HWY4_SALFA